MLLRRGREDTRRRVAPEAQVRRALEPQALGEVVAEESRGAVEGAERFTFILLVVGREPDPRALARELDHCDLHAPQSRIADLSSQQEIQFFSDELLQARRARVIAELSFGSLLSFRSSLMFAHGHTHPVRPARMASPERID